MTDSSPPRDLIERASSGDRAAFDALYQEHADRVEYYVRLRLGADLRKSAEVEDVLQEVALRACRSLCRFEWQGEGSFLRWLKGVAENVILEIASRGRRSPLLPLPEDKTQDAPSHETLLRRGERFDRLQRAFDGLPADHRKVILLARLERLPLNVVAERMERSSAAVKQLLWRALKELRAAFGETESLGLPDRALRDRGAGDA